MKRPPATVATRLDDRVGVETPAAVWKEPAGDEAATPRAAALDKPAAFALRTALDRSSKRLPPTLGAAALQARTTVLEHAAITAFAAVGG